jgi:hypothetical protein
MARPEVDRDEGHDGFCYLCLYDCEVKSAVTHVLGAYPRVSALRALGWYDLFGIFSVGKQGGFLHAASATRMQTGLPYERGAILVSLVQLTCWTKSIDF